MSDREILELLVKNMEQMNSKIEQMDTQINENTQLTKAILHRQEETDAKLDNLTFHHHKLYGEVVGLKETVNAIKGEIQFTYEKTSRNELEIFKLKRDLQSEVNE